MMAPPASLWRSTALFAGWGQVPGEEDRAPTEQEQEKADRPLWLMLVPTVALLGLALVLGDWTSAFAPHAAGQMMQRSMPDTALGPIAVEPTSWPWLAVAGAVVLAVYHLSRRQFPDKLRHAIDRATRPVGDVLHGLHSGLIGDYVTWVVVGLAVFVIAFAIV